MLLKSTLALWNPSILIFFNSGIFGNLSKPKYVASLPIGRSAKSIEFLKLKFSSIMKDSSKTYK